MGSEPEVTTTATRYSVTALPEGHVDARHFTITVEPRAGGWCVFHLGETLDADGGWSREYTRFDLETALRLAEQEAPKLTVNGLTVADVLDRAAS